MLLDEEASMVVAEAEEADDATSRSEAERSFIDEMDFRRLIVVVLHERWRLAL